MNLFEVIKTLKPTTTQPEMIPDFYMGLSGVKASAF